MKRPTETSMAARGRCTLGAFAVHGEARPPAARNCQPQTRTYSVRVAPIPVISLLNPGVCVQLASSLHEGYRSKKMYGDKWGVTLRPLPFIACVRPACRGETRGPVHHNVDVQLCGQVTRSARSADLIPAFFKCCATSRQASLPSGICHHNIKNRPRRRVRAGPSVRQESPATP